MLVTLAATDFFMRRLAFPGLVLNRSVRTSVDTLQNLLLKGRTKNERKKERKKEKKDQLRHSVRAVYLYFTAHKTELTTVYYN
jgi:hypothetical protein